MVYQIRIEGYLGRQWTEWNETHLEKESKK
jgi:hypothetical protein